jgi:hypothetical protein
MPQIVTVNVTQVVAPTPSQLQKTGALVTQGGTNGAANTVTLLTQLSDLAAIIGTGAAATELTAMATTFFAQGSTQAVYVLELGAGTTAAGVSALNTYITNSPPNLRFYSYLLPSEWDIETTAHTFVSTFDSPTSETYFYVTTTTATYAPWQGNKSVFAVIQNPSAPVTEFSAAAFFYVSLSYAPSSINLVAPMQFSYLYGVTPYSTLTSANQTTYLNAGLNWVGTGAQGGISNTLIVGGQFMDVNVSSPQGGNPFNYWYAIDWLSINVAIALANAVINGSNTPTNPLYYDQAGINTLQTVAQTTVNNAIAFGLIINPAKVNAIPYATYIKQNPGDYAIGRYAGLSCTFTPLRGFSQIVIYLTATNFPV